MDESVVGTALSERGISFRTGMSIVCVVRPTVGAYAYGLGGVIRISKEHILNFSGHGIAVVPLTDLNGQPNAEDAVFIPNDQIVETRMDMRRLGFVLTVETRKGPLEYKVRRYAIGMPWHRENLATILLAAGGGEGRQPVGVHGGSAGHMGDGNACGLFIGIARVAVRASSGGFLGGSGHDAGRRRGSTADGTDQGMATQRQTE